MSPLPVQTVGSLILFLTLAVQSALAEAPRGTLAVDPVELVARRELAGNEQFAVEHDGYRYLFASAENKSTFEKDPQRFEIRLGGACGRMGPLSGLGTPEIHAVHDGRIYIFASQGCKEGFLSDPEKMLDRDDPVPIVTEASAREGRRLLEKAVEVMGGAAKIDAMRNFRVYWAKPIEQDGEQVLKTRTLTMAFPDRMRNDQSLGDYKWSLVANADKGCFISSDGVRRMHASARQALAREFTHNPIAILKAHRHPDLVVAAAGDGTVGDVPVKLVKVALAGVTHTLGIDPRSGRILSLAYRGRGPDSYFGTMEKIYSDFRSVDGVLLPFTAAVKFDGKPVEQMTHTLTSLELNIAIDPALFEID